MLRFATTASLVLAAWAWATLLTVGGAILATSPGGFGPWEPRVMTLWGLAGVAAGVFVFEVMVADRLFPRARGRWVVGLEVSAGGLMLLFAAAGVAALIAR